MSTLNSKNNISLVTLILPKDSLSSVSKDLQKAGAKGIFHVAARGSIINEGGFLSKMFPPPSPEQCLVQVLVPDSEKQRITDTAIASGRLDRMGSGAIFNISCKSAQFTNHFPLTDGNEEFSHASSGDALEAICCICEKKISNFLSYVKLVASIDLSRRVCKFTPAKKDVPQKRRLLLPAAEISPDAIAAAYPSS